MLPLMSVELRARREARGLSQELAAERLGVDKDTVSRGERGKNRPLGVAVIESLRVLYGVTQAELDDWFSEWSTRRVRESDKYFIRGHEFLAASGMDEEELLEKIIELDVSMVPYLTTIDEGTVEQWAPIFQSSPLTWRLLTHGGTIVGYWHYVCLEEQYFDQVKNGTLRDSQINLPMLEFPCFLSPDKTYKMYVVMMGVHNSHQFFGPGNKLVNSFLREIERAAVNGVFFSEFLTVAYTAQGMSLCRNFGLEQVGRLGLPNSNAMAGIFHGTADKVARIGHASKHPGLARAYKERFR
jgi:transcriptional regulator with XRE-family HTH domain